jgi:phosphoserine phosphatase RsbU/P
MTSPDAAVEHGVEAPSRENDDDEARLIQRALLPPLSLVTEGFDISYRLSSYFEVGGDFLDYFVLPNGQLGLYLGDVVGKGLAAAMYASLAMGTFRGIHKNDRTPASVVELFNRRLRVRAVPRRYCAAQYALFDPSTLELRIANAGLPYPVRFAEAGCAMLGGGGLPAGLFDDVQYEESRIQLTGGDFVLFATDGLHEAQNVHGEHYGPEALMTLRRSRQPVSSEDLLDRILADVAEFSRGRPMEDDVTAVALVVSQR